MTLIRTRIRIGRDRRITGMAPPEVPPGEHEAMITLAPSYMRQPPTKKFNIEDLPKNDGPGTTAFPSAERICMATTVGDPVFVDTNVLVYSTRPLSAHHTAAARALARIGAGGATLWISPQNCVNISRW